MEKHNFLKIFVLLKFIFVFGLISNGQSASATWAGTSNDNSVVAGNVSGASISVTGATKHSNHSSGYRARYWGTSSTRTTTKHIEYQISPTSGNSLSVSSISFKYKQEYGSTRNLFVYYSTDDFGTETQLGGTYSATTSHQDASETGLGISVPDGSNLKVRFYFCNLSSYRGVLKDVVISGTTANASLSVNYTDSYCSSGSDPTPTLSNNAGSGTYSSTGGLSINSSTGVIDLSASTAGTYTITYTDSDAATTNDNVTIYGATINAGADMSVSFGSAISFDATVSETTPASTQTLYLTTYGDGSSDYPDEKMIYVATASGNNTNNTVYSQGTSGFITDEAFTVTHGTKYYVKPYDTYGDGWDDCSWKIEDAANGNTLFSRLAIDDGGYWQTATEIEPTGISSHAWTTGASNGNTGWSANNTEDITVSNSATSSHSGTYTLTTTYTNGCTFSDDILVTVTVPTITTTGSLSAMSSCSNGNSSEESFSVSGTNLTANLVVTPPAGYEVSTTSGSGFGSSISLSPSSGTVSSSTVYVRTAIGASNGASGDVACTSTNATTQNVATSSATITTAANAGTLSGTEAVCMGGSTTFSSDGDGGGSWTSATGGVATINSSGVITPVSAGTSLMTYTVTGTGGCSNATATRTVTVTAAPNAGTLSGTEAVCMGGSTSFSSNGDAGAWTSASTGVATINSSSGAISPQSAGTSVMTYTVTGTGGCSNATANRTVTVNALPTANAGTDVAHCTGSGSSLSASGGVSYSWIPSTGLSSTSIAAPTASHTSTTTYTVTATDGNGCTDTDDIDVTVNPNPTVSAGADQSVIVSNTISLDGSSTLGPPATHSAIGTG